MTSRNGESVYEKLRLQYNVQGSAAVRKIVLQILKVRFTPEEAELALLMPAGRGVTSVGQLVEETGLGESRARGLVDSMTDKGIVQWRRNRDNISWIKDPGKEDLFRLFDFSYSMNTPMVGDGTTNDMKRKVIDLLMKLEELGWGLDIGRPMVRWLPAEEFVDPSEELAPWERFSHYAKQAGLITVAACGCRATLNRCSRSVFSCFHFDDDAYHWVNYRGTRPLTPEEAIQIQRDALREGLCCQGVNCQEQPTIMCQCCSDDCIVLRPYNEKYHPGNFIRSNFLPQWDMEKCKQCFTCKDACPVHAIMRGVSHRDEERDKPVVLEDRCLGCGVCAAACPRQAISLKRVRNEIPAQTVREALFGSVSLASRS